MRFLLAFILMCAIFFGQLKHASKKTYLKGIGLGTILYLAFLFQTVGLVYTTPSKNAFLTAFNVVLVPFIGALFFKRKVTVPAIVGALLSISGIAVLSLTDFHTINFGDMLTLLCALFFALQIIFTNRFVLGENIYALTTIQMGTAALLGLTVSLVRGEFVVTAAGEGYFSIFYLGIVSTMLGFLIQTASQQFTKETETAIILSLEAVFGMVASALFLKEEITLRMLIGAALILAGVLVVELKPKKVLENQHPIADVPDER
jgi:drug/metabolite transporter (DMT)-like permease